MAYKQHQPMMQSQQNVHNVQKNIYIQYTLKKLKKTLLANKSNKY